MTPQFPPQPKPLSNSAARVLAVLRRQREHADGNPLTDEAIARLALLKRREIIDLAAELLEHGYLVIATCRKPCGRYLLRPGDDLTDAYEYAKQLNDRAVATMYRAKLVRLACAQAEQGRASDDRGQLSLGMEVERNPRKETPACFTR